MNVPVLIEFTVRSNGFSLSIFICFHRIEIHFEMWPFHLQAFSMNVNDATTSNYGKRLQIVSIACQLLQLLMKRFSVATVVWVQIYKIWNKFAELFDQQTFQTQAYCVIYCGAIQIKKSRFVQVLQLKSYEMSWKVEFNYYFWMDYFDSQDWGENDRGVSFTFGADVVSRFLRMHDLELICRGHQVNYHIAFRKLPKIVKSFFFFNLIKVVEDGYEFFAKRQLVTLFSAPNYCGEFDNAGGMMTVDESLLCSFQVNCHHPRTHFIWRLICFTQIQLFPLTDSEAIRKESEISV